MRSLLIWSLLRVACYDDVINEQSILKAPAITLPDHRHRAISNVDVRLGKERLATCGQRGQGVMVIGKHVFLRTSFIDDRMGDRRVMNDTLA